MKNKILIILLFILFAIPIPIAIVGFLFSFVWIVSVIVGGLRYVEMLYDCDTDKMYYLEFDT